MSTFPLWALILTSQAMVDRVLLGTHQWTGNSSGEGGDNLIDISGTPSLQKAVMSLPNSLFHRALKKIFAKDSLGCYFVCRRGKYFDDHTSRRTLSHTHTHRQIVGLFWTVGGHSTGDRRRVSITPIFYLSIGHGTCMACGISLFAHRWTSERTSEKHTSQWYHSFSFVLTYSLSCPLTSLPR